MGRARKTQVSISVTTPDGKTYESLLPDLPSNWLDVAFALAPEGTNRKACLFDRQLRVPK